MKSNAQVVFFILLGLAGACGNSSDESESPIDRLKGRLEQPSDSDVIVVAHRTCWRETAENSLSGIRKCVALGVDMIEIDVRVTADGQLVLMHDETLDRTTDGTGLLAGYSLQGLEAIRLKTGAGGNAAELTAERIPTLEQALIEAKGRLLVNLDIKEEHYTQALSIAQAVGSADQIIIKMRAPADDPALRDAAFHGLTYFMPIIRECNEDPARECTESLVDAIPEYARHDPIAIEVVNHTDAYLLSGIPAAQEMGVRVWVNTLGPRFAAGRSDEKSLADPDENWGWLVDHGVDMIQTDRPEALLRYLEKKGARRARQ